MNEIIPVQNQVETEANKETVLLSDTEAIPLAPDAFTIENIKNNLGLAIDAATDYPSVMDIVDEAVGKYGHQTVQTVLSARFNDDPSPDNKFYLDLVGDVAEFNTVSAPESLEEPDFEGVSSLLEVISEFSSEDIKEVAAISTAEEGFSNPLRKRMKDSISSAYKLACKLRWESKACLDTDKTRYPEFWQIFDKFEAMYQAVGVIDTKEKTVRRDISLKS